MAQKISKDMNIMEIVQICPESVAVFQKYGLGCIGCAAAHFENLEAGAKVHGFDPDAMVDDIIDANKKAKVPFVDPTQIKDYINRRYPNATPQQKQMMFTTFYKKCADHNKPYNDNIQGALDEADKSLHHTNKVIAGAGALAAASAGAATGFKKIADEQARKKKEEKEAKKKDESKED